MFQSRFFVSLCVYEYFVLKRAKMCIFKHIYLYVYNCVYIILKSDLQMNVCFAHILRRDIFSTQHFSCKGELALI